MNVDDEKSAHISVEEKNRVIDNARDARYEKAVRFDSLPQADR